MRVDKHTVVVYKNPETFIGYRDGAHVSTVSSEEWEIAEQELKEAVSGTKLRCYNYCIKPYGYDDDEAKQKLSTHTFVVINKKVYAISNDNDSSLISKKESDKLPLDKKISDQEWAFAKRKLSSKDNTSHAKLPRHSKLYKTFSHPETGAPVTLKHSFIKIGDEIYAMAGQGHEVHGGAAKIKIVANKAGKLFALKLLHKRQVEISIPNAWLNSFKEETTISTEVGFALASASKITGSPQQQPMILLRFFEMDFFTFFEKLPHKLLRPITHGEREKIYEEEYKKLFNILLQLTAALENLHVRGVIHGDVKIENTLISVSDKIEALLGDYGFATKMDECGKAYAQAMGTIEMIPPEIIGRDAAGAKIRGFDHSRVTYCAQTDIFSLGKTLKKVHSYLEEIKTKLGIEKENCLPALIQGMTNFDPKDRLHLAYARVILADYLLEKNYCSEDEWKRYILPLTTSHGATFICNLVNKQQNNFPKEFFDTAWIDRIAALEKDFISGDELTQEKIKPLFYFLHEKTQSSFFNPEKIKRVFEIYQDLKELKLTADEFNSLIHTAWNKPEKMGALQQTASDYKKQCEDLQGLEKRKRELRLKLSSSQFFAGSSAHRQFNAVKDEIFAAEFKLMELKTQITNLITPAQSPSRAHGL